MRFEQALARSAGQEFERDLMEFAVRTDDESSSGGELRHRADEHLPEGVCVARNVLARTHSFQEWFHFIANHVSSRQTLEPNGRARRDDDVRGWVQERELQEELVLGERALQVAQRNGRAWPRASGAIEECRGNRRELLLCGEDLVQQPLTSAPIRC